MDYNDRTATYLRTLASNDLTRAAAFEAKATYYQGLAGYPLSIINDLLNRAAGLRADALRLQGQADTYAAKAPVSAGTVVVDDTTGAVYAGGTQVGQDAPGNVYSIGPPSIFTPRPAGAAGASGATPATWMALGLGAVALLLLRRHK